MSNPIQIKLKETCFLLVMSQIPSENWANIFLKEIFIEAHLFKLPMQYTKHKTGTQHFQLWSYILLPLTEKKSWSKTSPPPQPNSHIVQNHRCRFLIPISPRFSPKVQRATISNQEQKGTTGSGAHRHRHPWAVTRSRRSRRRRGRWCWCWPPPRGSAPPWRPRRRHQSADSHPAQFGTRGRAPF